MSAENKTDSNERVTASAGSASFDSLCAWLICEAGYSYLYPEISRTRSTDWMAFIFTHHDKERRVELAVGQADTMDAACADCVREKEQCFKRIMALESIAPRKITLPDGKVMVWHCPEELIPDITPNGEFRRTDPPLKP